MSLTNGGTCHGGGASSMVKRVAPSKVPNTGNQPLCANCPLHGCPRPPQKREIIMSKAHLYIALRLAAIAPAGAGRYGKPSASAPPSLYADAGLSYERLVVDGL